MEDANDLLQVLVVELNGLLQTAAFVCDAIEDDDERNERRREIVHVDIECWRKLGDPTFHDHFRMTRTVFERLIVVVGRHLTLKNRLHFIRTPLDVSLLMSVWVLATPDTFRSVGTTFGFSKGVVFYHYLYIIEALRELAATYITWPGPIEKDIIKHDFNERYGYPGVVGCIDCCQIKIYAPKVQAHRYINRHHDHAIMIQAVCDNNLLYRDVYVGEPGAVGDARAFQRSPLSRNLFCRGGFLEDDEHLLGDGAYPISKQIIIPYTDDGHLTLRQRVHNYTLSRCRATVERSFARLKGKLRRLKHLSSYRLEYAVDHIMASLVLHNFIILEGQLPGLLGDHLEIFDVQGAPQDIRVALDAARENGGAKRLLLSGMLID